MYFDPEAKRIQVFLPVTLERYAAHYRKRAEEGVITFSQIKNLIQQLNALKDINKEALIENTMNMIVNEDIYYEKNSPVASALDALIAFQVNESNSVEDTV